MPSYPPSLRRGDPDHLGAYRLLGFLGEGGQGTVYLGLDPDGRQVAVKVMHAWLAKDDRARKRFMREVEAARQVKQFCTARVLDVAALGDSPYIVSEYVPGESLRDLIVRDGPRESDALERLAIGTATALSAIHQAGVVHRDFKPTNVLMGTDGPRVIDFGLARALDPAMTESGELIGSPAYLSPEQIATGRIGPPSDMFSWGVTMVYAATGVPAFGSDSVPTIMHRILNNDPDLSRLPRGLRVLVAGSLAKQPEERPTAADVLLTLLGYRIPLASLEEARRAVEPERPRALEGPKALRGPRMLEGPRAREGSWTLGGPKSGQLVVAAEAENAVAVANAADQIAEADRADPPVALLAEGTQAASPPTAEPATVGTADSVNDDLTTLQWLDLAVPEAEPSGHDTSSAAESEPATAAIDGGIWGLFPPDRQDVGDAIQPPGPSEPQAATPIPVRARPRLSGGLAVSAAVVAVLLTVVIAVTGMSSPGPDSSSSASGDQQRTGDRQQAVDQQRAVDQRLVGQPLTGHSDTVTAVAYGQLGNRPIAITGSADGTARVWDVTDHRPLGEPLNGNAGSVYAVAYGRLGNRPVAITGHNDHTARVWDLTTHRQIGQPLTGHSDPVTAVAFGQLGNRPIAITGSWDASVRVWDLATHQQLGEPLNGNAGSVYAVAYGRLGSRPVAITGNKEQVAQVWDLATHQQIGSSLTGHTGEVHAVAFGQLDNRPIAITGSWDATVRVWDLATQQQLGQPLNGQAGMVFSVAYGQVGDRPIAITGENNNTARIWDLTTHRQIGQPLTGHRRAITALAFGRLGDQSIAITGGGTGDSTVRKWNLGSS